METLLRKIKNWILPLLITVAGGLDLAFGLMNEIADLVEIPAEFVKYMRIAAFIVTAVILKLQKPTKNPDKLQAMVTKLRTKRGY